MTVRRSLQRYGCFYEYLNLYLKKPQLTRLLQAGAGIRVPPNSSRLLMRWGVDFTKMKKSKSEGYHFVRWKDGDTIVKIPFADANDTYGAPYYLVHRHDLHAELLNVARRAGVSIHTNQRVTSYDFDAPSATTQDGKTWTADLIVCADGMLRLLFCRGVRACITALNAMLQESNRSLALCSPASRMSLATLGTLPTAS